MGANPEHGQRRGTRIPTRATPPVRIQTWGTRARGKREPAQHAAFQPERGQCRGGRTRTAGMRRAKAPSRLPAGGRGRYRAAHAAQRHHRTCRHSSLAGVLGPVLARPRADEPARPAGRSSRTADDPAGHRPAAETVYAPVKPDESRPAGSTRVRFPCRSPAGTSPTTFSAAWRSLSRRPTRTRSTFRSMPGCNSTSASCPIRLSASSPTRPRGTTSATFR